MDVGRIATTERVIVCENTGRMSIGVVVEEDTVDVDFRLERPCTEYASVLDFDCAFRSQDQDWYCASYCTDFDCACPLYHCHMILAVGVLVLLLSIHQQASHGRAEEECWGMMSWNGGTAVGCPTMVRFAIRCATARSSP